MLFLVKLLLHYRIVPMWILFVMFQKDTFDISTYVKYRFPLSKYKVAMQSSTWESTRVNPTKHKFRPQRAPSISHLTDTCACESPSADLYNDILYSSLKFTRIFCTQGANKRCALNLRSLHIMYLQLPTSLPRFRTRPEVYNIKLECSFRTPGLFAHSPVFLIPKK